MFVVRVDSNVQSEWLRAMVHLADGIRSGVQSAVREGAQEARRVRKFQDRTGNLYRSIRGYLVKYDRFGADGVMVAGTKYASFIEGGTRPHVIAPRNKPRLAWERPEGTWHILKPGQAVNHPGQRHPMPFMGPAYLKAERVLERDINSAISRVEL